METIYALATPPGKSGVAVVRISGERAKAALTAICSGHLPVRRLAAVRSLHHPLTGLKIDQALVLWFEGPNSFTGEDVAELHLHGSRAVVKSVLDALGAVPGLRLAEPGEFSRRAFLNGKMDLTEAEGIADLIDAETEAQARQALRQMSGELKNLYEDWRAQIIGCMAKLEAYIDFPDEPLPPKLEQEITHDIAALKASLERHLADNRRGERLREGARIAIIGAPNAGKSSLLNHLSRRDIAIVSPLPGTTRDALEAHLDIGGYPVTLIDTAGIRTTDDAIESEGVTRALRHAGDADITLVLLDGETYPAIPSHIEPHLSGGQNLVAVTKSDIAKPIEKSREFYPISAHSGSGIDALLTDITARLDTLMSPGDAPQITRARHRQQAEAASSALALFLENTAGAPIELRAELLRQAATSLGHITGTIDVEDVLDKLFSSFCIGK